MLRIDDVRIVRRAAQVALGLPVVPQTDGFDSLQILVSDDDPKVTGFGVQATVAKGDERYACVGEFPKAEIYSTMCYFQIPEGFGLDGGGRLAITPAVSEVQG